jgi:NAD(P)-dependent dehydrogenase (short-subunit alcohol dehydrogenase family)
MGLLDGKVAIVTGAGGGLGRAHALALAKEGAALVVNDLGGDRTGSGQGKGMADHVVDEIKKAGGEAVACYDSVATAQGGQAIVDAALKNFDKADILVNNAGILRDKTLAKTEEADWDQVIAVHLRGTFCCTKPMFQHLKDRGQGGVIVTTSSTSGLIGNFGQCNYGAAKAGIAGFTRCLALEGKKYNIRVWGLVPVAVTRMTEDLPGMGQMKERLDPALVSPVLLYMVSELSGDRTGKFLFAGGGRVAELKVVGSEGVNLGAGLTPQQIAKSADKIFMEDKPFNLFG